MKSTTLHGRPGETAHHGLRWLYAKTEASSAGLGFARSIHQVLQLLHWQGPHSLRRWLGFEHTRLFRERVDTFTSRLRILLLQLQVHRPSDLEGAVLLQLVCCKFNIIRHDALNDLRLQASSH